MLDEAKRWFEASTVICRFVPGGKDRAEKVGYLSIVYIVAWCMRLVLWVRTHPGATQISETYTQLLGRYGSHPSL